MDEKRPGPGQAVPSRPAPAPQPGPAPVVGTGPVVFDPTHARYASGPGGFAAAWDRMAAEFLPPVRGEPPPVLVRLPAGPIAVDDPVLLERSYLRVEGAGRWATRLAPAPCVTPLIAGLRAAPPHPATHAPVALTAAHRPDLFGRMDATWAPAAGKRWGYRLLKDSLVGFSQGGPLASGPTLGGWPTVPVGTIEWAVDGCGTVPVDTGSHQLFGTYDGRWVPSFSVGPGGAGDFGLGAWLFRFRTSEQGPYATDRMAILLPPAGDPALACPGLLRCTLQFDLGKPDLAGAFQVYFHAEGGSPVQGRVVAYRGTGQGGPSWPLPAGVGLGANPTMPFVIGAATSNPCDCAGTPPPDHAIAGLAVRRGPVYANDGPGTPQRRLDGRPITDAGRYDWDPAAIAWLSLNDGPDGRYGGRLLHYNAGPQSGANGRCWGWQSSIRPDGSFIDGGGQGPAYQSVVGLAIEGAGHGEGLCLGNPLHFHAEDLGVRYARIGIVSFALNSTYRTTVRGLHVQGCTDLAILQHGGYCAFEDVTVDPAGGGIARFVDCRARLEGLHLGGMQPRQAPPGVYGIESWNQPGGYECGLHVARLDIYDGEFFDAPTGALIYAQAVPQMTVTVRDVTCLQLGPAAAGVLLDEPRPVTVPAGQCEPTVVVDGWYQRHPQYGSIVRVYGPSWRGTVANPQLPVPARTKVVDDRSGTGRVRVV
jgi:hypothetical protein